MEVFHQRFRIQVRCEIFLRSESAFKRAEIRCVANEITLFAEVVNLYNHRNVRFDDVRGIDVRTGSVRLGFEKLFPILPSAGLSIDF